MSTRHENIRADLQKYSEGTEQDSESARNLVLYHELNESIRRNNPHRALELARKSLDIATRICDRFWMARSMVQIGHCFEIMGSYDAALRNFSEAESLFRACGAQRDQAGAAQLIGIVHKRRGSFDAALEWYVRSLDLRQAIGDKRGIGKLDVSIGNLLRKTGRLDEALERFLASLQISEDLDDVYGQMLALHNIGNVYFTLEEYQPALEYYERSLELSRDQPDRQSEATTLCNIGYAYHALGDGDSALHYLERGHDLARILDDKQCLLSILSIRAEIDTKRGRTKAARAAAQESLKLASYYADDAAVCQLEQMLGAIALLENRLVDAYPHLQTALKIADKLESADLRSQVHLSLSEYYEQSKKIELALDHHKQYATLREAVRELSVRESTQRMQSRYDLEHERKEKEIYRLRNVELNRALHELNYSNERLQRVDRERGNLIDIVAHDIKNPLSNILLQVRQMLNVADVGSEVVEFTKDVEFTVRQMLDFVDDLLTASRMESDGVLINQEEFDITMLLRQLVTGFSSKLENKRMRLNLNMPEHECRLIADRRALIQVVDNLLSNAVKFSPPESTVRVILEQTNDGVELHVADEGPGVPVVERGQLFRKFGRLSNKPTGGESSTGVGLWIVKKLLNGMDGQIEYRDAAEGGALFIIKLPLNGRTTDSLDIAGETLG